MIQKKICMVGSFAVGKSSLVARFVHQRFDERYHATIGVKIDRKEVTVGDQLVRLIVWDLYGEDEFEKMQATYLRGSAGALIVADGTRPDTVRNALDLRHRVEQAVGPIPVSLLLNKHDLKDAWCVGDADLQGFVAEGVPVLRTSAKDGEGVEAAFLGLGQRLLG